LAAVPGCGVHLTAYRGILPRYTAGERRCIRWISDVRQALGERSYFASPAAANDPLIENSDVLIEGRPTLVFASAAQKELTSTTISLPQPLTVFIVMNRTAISGDAAAKSYVISTATNFVYNVNAAGNEQMYGGTVGMANPNAPVTNEWRVHALRYSGPTSCMMHNGVVQVENTDIGSSGVANQACNISGFPAAGNDREFLDGSIAELAIIQGALSNGSMNSVSRSLMGVYNIDG
jgi:hypothetical protein